MKRRFRLPAILAAIAVSAGLVGASPAAAELVCDTETGGTKFYPGDDSSLTYNNLFNPGASIDHYLQNYVPQGLGVWENWNGTSEDLFMVGMHHRDENSNQSLVYGMTVSGGTVRGAAYLPVGAHVGGLKVHGSYLYIQRDTSTIRRYPLSVVRASFESSGIQALTNGIDSIVTDVSYFDIDGGYLYGGFFEEDVPRLDPNSRSLLRRYAIASNGALTRDYSYGPIQTPIKAQGLLVLSNTWIFSTSAGRNNRSNIYAIRRGYSAGENIESVRYRCFRAPVLSQELVGFGGRTYLNFEGGADEFDGLTPLTTADNKIKNLHWANTETLRSLVW